MVVRLNYTIETEQEDDGRWICELATDDRVVLVYGPTRREAVQTAIRLLDLLADR